MKMKGEQISTARISRMKTPMNTTARFMRGSCAAASSILVSAIYGASGLGPLVHWRGVRFAVDFAGITKFRKVARMP